MNRVVGLAILLGTLLSSPVPAAETMARNRAAIGKSSAPASAAQPSRPGGNGASRNTSDGGDQLSSEQSARLQESLQKQRANERMMSNVSKRASDTTQFVTRPIKD